MFDRRYNSSPLTAAILATLYPSLSLGQQTQAESGKLETIIVTATRRELNLQEVPQSDRLRWRAIYGVAVLVAMAGLGYLLYERGLGRAHAGSGRVRVQPRIHARSVAKYGPL